MFADYGDFGRRFSVRSVAKIVAAPIKVVAAAAKQIAPAITKVTKPIVKSVINPLANPLKSIAMIALAPIALAPGLLAKAGLDIKKMKRQSIGTDPDTGKEVLQYQDENGNTITEAQYNEIVAKYAAEEKRLAGQQTQDLGIQVTPAMTAMTAVNLPQAMPTQVPWTPPRPTRNYRQYIPYSQPQQQVQQATQSAEQYQPQQSYYSQDRYPIQQENAMEDDFTQNMSEERKYSEYDFGDLGLDEDTVLLLKDAQPNVEAAIAAGQTYVDKIQGKTNTDIGAVITPEPTGLNAVPTWAWLALGAAALTMIATSSKPKSRRKKR